MEPRPKSMTTAIGGGVKVFSKSGSSLAVCGGTRGPRPRVVRGVDGGHRDDFDNGSRFLAGIELLGQKLHAGDSTKTGPWSCG